MNFDFINERIAVGQKIDSQEFANALQAAGITHVINLWSGNPEQYWKASSLTLKQEDDGTPRPADQVRAGVAYAMDALRDGGKLYVHCQWGMGRAPSMAYAILRRFGIPKTEAILLINTKRPIAATGGWWQYIPSIEEALKS